MATHDVRNQAPPLEDYNVFTSDPILSDAVKREGGSWGHEQLTEFGSLVGSAECYAMAAEANRYTPVLRSHDRFGNRIDEVDFHPTWHDFLALSVNHGLHSLPYEHGPGDGGRVVRDALFSVVSQVEAGHGCPISMTTSVVPSLRTNPSIADQWEPRILSRHYDNRFIPAPQKSGVLMGMGLTEKQGGSDVRANTSRAERRGDTEYRITGHKWFTSAPMSDAFLMLAQASGGLSCFFVPRFTPDGERNRVRIQRLKDKLGNRSNASAEIELEGVSAWLVGEEGAGVPTIIEMINGTRIDCVVGSVGIMRQAVAQAAWHAEHRTAFGSHLIDKPLMQNVLADLEVEVEAATLMMTRLSGAFDRAGVDRGEKSFKRIATPIAKYWVTKRCTEVVREAMECLGGNGYVEESILPRLFRESPLNAIWEGSGNVIALDVLRVVEREPNAIDVFLASLEMARGVDRRLDGALDTLMPALEDRTAADARRLTEMLAIVWGGALLVRHGDEDVADLYCRSRLDGDYGSLFGTLPPVPAISRVSRRAVPAV